MKRDTKRFSRRGFAILFFLMGVLGVVWNQQPEVIKAALPLQPSVYCELPLLDHLSMQVLLDVYDNPYDNNLIADDIQLELYTKRVLPNEWFSSWNIHSLYSGAIAIRSYALDKKYRWRQLYAGEYGQVYSELCYVGGQWIPCENISSTSSAVDGTYGNYMAMDYNTCIPGTCVTSDAPIEAQHYSETGNPTQDLNEEYPYFPCYPYLVAVPDAHMEEGTTMHPGMCQHGSQYYADQEQWGFRDILWHYYPPHLASRIGSGAPFAGGRIEGDMDGDCDVDVVDIMLVASRWDTQVGDPDYVPFYDSEHDCDIDVVDIMRVAAHWNEFCP